MKTSFLSLIVKKYSLTPVKIQIILQWGLLFLLCGLSLVPFEVNQHLVNLSFAQSLVILSWSFLGVGALAAAIELKAQEAKQVHLVLGHRTLTARRILLVEGIDVLLHAVLMGIVLMGWCEMVGTHPVQSIGTVLYFPLGSLTAFYFSYALSLCLHSSMAALSILFLFPLLVQPFLERMAPFLAEYMMDSVVSDVILGRSTASHLLCFGFYLILSSSWAMVQLSSSIRE